jgi:peptide/nickel transport system permease protein
MSRRHTLRSLLAALWQSPTALLGVALLLAFVVVALAAPWVAPHSPSAPNLLLRLAPPAWISGDAAHLLGTDHLGRDILSRLIYGTRIALVVGALGVSLSAFIGITLGALAGYVGGLVDTLISRLIDTLLAIPNIILYLAVLFAFGASLVTLVLVIGGVGWTTFARVVRAEVLALRNREFVEAARATGQRPVWVLLKHVLPNTIAPILVVATLKVASVIILEASLSFLGLGVQPPTVTWGRMLADGRGYVATAWWLATFPGLTITILCLALISIGDWLRDLFDPRIQGG